MGTTSSSWENTELSREATAWDILRRAEIRTRAQLFKTYCFRGQTQQQLNPENFNGRDIEFMENTELNREATALQISMGSLEGRSLDGIARWYL